jgi:hypothetical protein
MIQVETRHQDKGQDRTPHEDVAMGEIDELDDPVDHGVAERDQRKDRSARDAVNRLLNEEVEPVHEAINPKSMVSDGFPPTSEPRFI